MEEEGRLKALAEVTKEEGSIVMEVERTCGESMLRASAKGTHIGLPIPIESSPVTARFIPPFRAPRSILERESPSIGEADAGHRFF